MQTSVAVIQFSQPQLSGDVIRSETIMEIKTSRGSAESAHSKTIAEYGIKDDAGQPVTKVTFEYKHREFASLDEVPAELQPSAKDILSLVNTTEKQNERNKAQNAAFKALGIEKPTDEDPVTAFRNMVKILVAQKMSQEDAEATAKTLVPAYKG